METIYGRLGGAAKREPAAQHIERQNDLGTAKSVAVAVAPTPETDSYPTGSIEALIHASRTHNGMSVGMPKIHVDSGWVEHILIRSRKLERERDAARKELAEFSSFGTVEVMVRNKQVNEFIRNLESRAEAAETRLREIGEAAKLPAQPLHALFVTIAQFGELRNHALHLAAENLKLREDVERLDWLDSWGCEYNDLLRNAWCLPFPPGIKSTTRDLRDAIDAARKAKEEK